ncbi:MAG: ACT domain-containing protein [Erysipelotrichaceae bacterium]|nr:ACT domain-containing protein [Erysipelotrichaceae bacterium]
MKAVISVIGQDRVGILAMTANVCADHNVNVLEVSQTILEGVFSMTMIVNLDQLNITMDEFASEFEAIGEQNNLVIRVMNYEIFQAMHSI